MGVVDQPLYQRRRKAVVAKHGVSLAEFEVGGNDEASLLVAVANYPKSGAKNAQTS